MFYFHAIQNTSGGTCECFQRQILRAKFSIESKFSFAADDLISIGLYSMEIEDLIVRRSILKIKSS